MGDEGSGGGHGAGAEADPASLLFADLFDDRLPALLDLEAAAAAAAEGSSSGAAAAVPAEPNAAAAVEGAPPPLSEAEWLHALSALDPRHHHEVPALLDPQKRHQSLPQPDDLPRAAPPHHSEPPACDRPGTGQLSVAALRWRCG